MYIGKLVITAFYAGRYWKVKKFVLFGLFNKRLLNFVIMLEKRKSTGKVPQTSRQNTEC